jgi:hypothetical protein
MFNIANTKPSSRYDTGSVPSIFHLPTYVLGIYLINILQVLSDFPMAAL